MKYSGRREFRPAPDEGDVAGDSIPGGRPFRSGSLRGVICRDTTISEIEACLARFERPENSGVRVLKRSRATLVAAVGPCEGDTGPAVCVKRRSYTRRFESARSTLKRSRAMSSWRNGRRLEAMGIRVARPLAAVERRFKRRLDACFTITEMIPDARNLVEYAAGRVEGRRTVGAGGDLGKNSDREEIRDWRKTIADCARALRDLHERGVFFHDLKAENILIRAAKGPKAGPWFIDMDKVRIGRRVPDRQRIKNMAQLNASLHRILTRSDRLRFFVAYESGGPKVSGRGRRRLARIARETLSRLRREVRKKGDVTLDRRGKVGGLEAVEAAGMTWRARPDFLRHGGRAILEDLDRIAARPGAVVERDLSVRTTVRLPWSDEEGEPGRAVVVKRYHMRGWGDRLKYLFFTPKALAEWRMLCALRDLDIPTARPLALGWSKKGPVLRDSCLVMEAIPGVETLGEYMRASYLGRLDAVALSEKRDLLRSLAGFAARIHDMGVVHRDFHCDNFLLRCTNAAGPQGIRCQGSGIRDQIPSGSTCVNIYAGREDSSMKGSDRVRGWTFYLIDLHTARIRHRVRARRWMANLAKLLGSISIVMTRTDWMRFWLASRALRLGPAGRRAFRRLEKGARRYRSGLIRSRLGQPLKGKDIYACRKVGGSILHFRRAYDPELLLQAAGRTGTPGRARARGGDDSAQLRVTPFDVHEEGGLQEGRNAWVVGNYLAFYRVPTPEPAALIQGPGPKVWLLTVDPGPVVPLKEYCEAGRVGWAEPGGRRERGVLLEGLAALLERIAHHRLVLLDFGPDNIFVAEEREKAHLLVDDLGKVRVAEDASFRKRLVESARVRAVFSGVLTPDAMEALLRRLEEVSPGPSGTGVGAGERGQA